MKTLVILVLTIALAAAAFFTRPSESSFQDMIKQQSQEKGNFVEKLFAGMSTDSFLKNCTYKDHYLWTTVESDGKTIYIGAFAHWFEKATDSVKKTEGTKI